MWRCLGKFINIKTEELETETKPIENRQDDEISLRELILKLREWYHYLLSKWKVILLAGIIGGVLGFLYAYFKKPVYTAECTFVLEEQGNAGTLGQYAGLASMVGIDLGGAAGSGLFQGDNIIELYKSRSMIQRTLLTQADFNGHLELLIDHYIKSAALSGKWAEQSDLKNLSFHIPPSKYITKHDSIIGLIVDDINKNYLSVEKIDKKLSIISVKVKSKDEMFAKVLNEKLVETVNNFYVRTKTKKALENFNILQKQADSVKSLLNSSIGSAASAIDANPNANAALQILQVPSKRKQVDIQASSAMYSEIIKNLEIARITLRQSAPLIQVIDGPILPLKVERADVVVTTFILVAASAFVLIVLLILKRILYVIFHEG